MKVSVLIPTYNSSRTIRYTLSSVLQQTLSPLEIIVLDDGSTDDTVDVLRGYGSVITILQQKNQGVASARNELCRRARGELLAFIDHDDIWHPSYLDTQSRIYAERSEAIAFFTGHMNFEGYGDYVWENAEINSGKQGIKQFAPIEFLKIYNRLSGVFQSPSMMCVPKSVMKFFGEEPFCVKASGADDIYFCNKLPMFGEVVYIERPLVAYRIINEAQSVDKVRGCELTIIAFERLKEAYSGCKDSKLRRQFEIEFASSRRQYAKRLMGANKITAARKQLVKCLRDSNDVISTVKSLLLYLATILPRRFQPAWPPTYRAVHTSSDKT